MLTPFRYLFCIFWSILMISSSLVLMVVTLDRKLPVKMARTLWSPGILWACGIRLKVHYTTSLDDSVPYIFVSNHLSYLDIPALFRAIPHNLHFIAKKEIMWVPFIGQYMLATGMIFIDRSNRARAVESLTRAGKLIREGKDVLMFPEGTRSREGKVGEFKKGPFLLASQAGVRVVPIAIAGTDQVLQPGSFGVKPGVVNVYIGSPVPPDLYGDARLFGEEMRDQLVKMIDSGGKEKVEVAQNA